MRSRGSLKSVLDSVFLAVLNRYSSRYQEQLIEKPMPIVGYLADTISNSLIIGKFYEQDELDRIFQFLDSKSRVESSGTAVDMGANIGNHSLYLESRFAKVISFEPHPEIYSLLEINTRSYPKIKCYNLGLSRSKSSQKLFSSLPGNVGASSLFGHHGETNGVFVKLTPLDEIVKESTKISLIKIDVEGFELDALIGSSSVISRDSPVVLIERSPFDGTFEKSDDSLAWLEKNGYAFYWIGASSEPRKIVRQFAYLLKRWTVGHKVNWNTGWPPEQAISLVVALRESEAQVLPKL